MYLWVNISVATTISSMKLSQIACWRVRMQQGNKICIYTSVLGGIDTCNKWSSSLLADRLPVIHRYMFILSYFVWLYFFFFSLGVKNPRLKWGRIAFGKGQLNCLNLKWLMAMNGNISCSMNILKAKYEKKKVK